MWIQRSKVGGDKNLVMEIFVKENLEMICLMVKGHMSGQMELNIWVNFLMGLGLVREVLVL